MKIKWKVFLVALLSALILTNGAMAEKTKGKQKTWWRQKLIDADKELLGKKVGDNYVSDTLEEETEQEAKKKADALNAAKQKAEQEQQRLEQIRYKAQTKREADLKAKEEELKKKKEEAIKAAEEKKAELASKKEERQKQAEENKKAAEEKQKTSAEAKLRDTCIRR